MAQAVCAARASSGGRSLESGFLPESIKLEQAPHTGRPLMYRLVSFPQYLHLSADVIQVSAAFAAIVLDFREAGYRC